MSEEKYLIWLTWEDHRRSRELSKAFGAEYFPIILRQSRYIRYPVLIALTFLKVVKVRPGIIFCQNPSIVLTALLVFLKNFMRFKLIVDRHSNFKFEHEHSKKIKWKLFWYLSKLTVKGSDLTIVTNSPLKYLCEEWGGRSEVLPDKLPDMSAPAGSYINLIKNIRKRNVMAVTTFSGDEPIDEVIEAASILSTDFEFYLTGNYHKFLKAKGQGYAPPANVTFTGFISEADYRALMSLVDVVVVLTTKDLILNCGAYEAVSANKPLVLSKTETLMSYFTNGAIFVDLSPQEIADGVFQAWKQSEELKMQSVKLYRELEDSWEGQFEQVQRLVEMQ
jgi:hypothetical protein